MIRVFIKRNKYILGLSLIVNIVLITIIHYQYVHNSNNLEQKINQKMVHSLFTSSFFTNKYFPDIIVKQINNDSTLSTMFNEATIAILLSNAGCNPCQVRELILLDSLYKNSSMMKNVVAIYDGINKMEALYLKKVSQAKFPFFITKGAQFADFNFTKKYPIIFLIEKQKITFCYVPLAESDKFSKMAINVLQGRLTK